VRNAGGVLQLVIHELPVRCLPTEIPESIEVDVTALGVGDSIHVSDLSLPEGVEVLVEADQTICAVGAPRVMAEEGAAEGEAGVGPEAVSGGEEEEKG
jgi:large subunit ribosomal protein L25